MQLVNVKGVMLAAAAGQLVSSHTTFTNLYVDGANMGNGTCIRMSNDPDHATAPVRPITGNDMACGTSRPCDLGSLPAASVLVAVEILVTHFKPDGSLLDLVVVVQTLLKTRVLMD